MLNMAYAPLPKLVGANKLQSNDVENISLSLSEVLQSEPVKRLLNQPNIIIKTIPLSTQPKASLTSSMTNTNVVNVSKENGITDTDSSETKPSVAPVTSEKSIKEECLDDENLLPSKIEGKSEISLLPIERRQKDCGHDGPCENITCDVTIEQCIDHDGVSLMLAYSIEDDEINAPVWKHCNNDFCDALSIDHDRCRRAVIKLNRFDREKKCDVCGVTLKTHKSRVHHKVCKKQDEYRHNKMNGAQLLKERMREREIQMLEDAKTKKQDYMDPIAGYNRAMDVLRKNDELIIIPKTRPPQQPAVSITPSVNNQVNQQTKYVNNVSAKYLPNLPLMIPRQNIFLGKNTNSNENITPIAQTKVSHTLSNKIVTNTSGGTAMQNQFVKFIDTPQTGLQTIPLNDWLLSQSHVVTASTIQPKPILTPIRVVPITNLITQPSLLHQTQGIPKFCIMADNSVPSISVPNLKSAIPSKPANNLNVTSEESSKRELQKQRKAEIKNLRKRIRKKDLKCNYCSKHFSTDWYFKIHVAMHSSESISCRICKETFNNKYDIKKHVMTNHRNQKITCDNCDFSCTSYVLFDKHMKTHSTMKQSYKCLACNSTFASTNSLNSHKDKCLGQMETDTTIMETKSDCSIENEKTRKTGKKYENTNNINGTKRKRSKRADSKKNTKQTKQNKFSLDESNSVKTNGICLSSSKNNENQI